MGERELPRNFGEYALRGFIAETRDGLPWWQTCIASALVDLSRIDGFVTAFAGIANVLRHGEHPDWVVGGDGVKAAIDVALEWLDEGIDAHEVTGWLQAGCWDPKVARRLTAAGVHPCRLLNEDGKPAHWIEVQDGNKVPLALAVTEWQLPIADAIRIVTTRGDEVAAGQIS